MRITLACNAAMSTSIMKMKLREEMAARGIEGTVNAYPFSEAPEYMDETDIFLLGPQIRYVAEDFAKEVAPVPVVVIDMKDYNILKVGKLLDDAIAKLESND